MKAYIVEDHEAMRLILKRLLKKNFPGHMEIMESDNAEQALAEIPGFAPDIILVDISLPGMDGIELIRRLKPECKYLCILVVTGHEVEIYKEAAEQAGAHGIVSKMEDEKLIESIRELLEKRKLQGCA